ncbi:MAG: hypothetical protein ACLFTT_15015 [Candidatus Hydrogenedentota bacterium]
MSWTAPNVEHVLEQRLQTARRELLDDPRIQHASQARSTEGINFLVQLIEEKIAAAARIGMDAAEASLRHAAGNALINEGVPITIVRRTLEDAGQPLLEPKRMKSQRVDKVGPPPLHLAAGLFFVWTIAALAAWTLVGFPPTWCAIIVGAGGVPSVALYAWRESKLAVLKKDTVGDLPARAMRFYFEQLRNHVAAYERTVNDVIHTGARSEYALTMGVVARAGDMP